MASDSAISSAVSGACAFSLCGQDICRRDADLHVEPQQMVIGAGESVTLTLPLGFSGPRAFRRPMNVVSMTPPAAFQVFWTYDDSSTIVNNVTTGPIPPTILRICNAVSGADS